MKRFILLLVSCMLFVMGLPAYADISYGSVFVTSQRYDRGEMIWRSDVGTIFMLANDGQALRFPVTEYGSLPPSPWKTAPLGKIPPMLGFGKVWSNYDDVRAKLGWAYFPEVGRNTPLTQFDDGTLYMLTQSAKPVRINPNNTWQYVDHIPTTPTNPPPQSDPYFQSISVSPDEGKVGATITVSWNIINVDAAIVEFYDAYPRNDILYRIEDHHPSSGSTTFTIPAQTLHGITVTVHGARYDVDANGRTITARVINTSEVVDLIEDNPPADDPYIESVSVTPDEGKVGDTINVSWDIKNVDGVIVEFYDNYPRNTTVYHLVENQPTTGSTTFTIPEEISNNLRVTVHGVRYDVDANGRTITARVINTSEVVDLIEDDTPPAPVETWAVYQDYDNGMMIWRADTGMITVFFDDGSLRHYPLTYYAYLADVPADIDVPEGKIRPTNGFGRVWAYLDDVRERLGWAVDTETGYNLTITTLDSGEIEYNNPEGGKIIVTGGTWQS